MFMFIRRELGGTDTGCLFQFTYCAGKCIGYLMKGMWYHIKSHISVHRLCISALSSTGSILSNTDLSDLSTVGTCDIFVYQMRHRVM